MNEGRESQVSQQVAPNVLGIHNRSQECGDSLRASSQGSSPLSQRSAPLVTHAAAPHTVYQYQHLQAPEAHCIMISGLQIQAHK